MADNGATSGTTGAGGAAVPQRPTERYGSARNDRGPISGKLFAVVLAVLAVAVVVAIAAYLYEQFTAEKLSAEVVSSEAVDEQTMSITANVTSNRPEDDGYCIVRAKEYSGAEVGRAEVYIPAGRETTRIEVSFPTTGEPYAGDVYGCSFDVPEYLEHTAAEN